MFMIQETCDKITIIRHRYRGSFHISQMDLLLFCLLVAIADALTEVMFMMEKYHYLLTFVVARAQNTLKPTITLAGASKQITALNNVTAQMGKRIKPASRLSIKTMVNPEIKNKAPSSWEMLRIPTATPIARSHHIQVVSQLQSVASPPKTKAAIIPIKTAVNPSFLLIKSNLELV